MIYEGQIQDAAINYSDSTPLITATLYTNVVGGINEKITLYQPFGFTSIPVNGTQCSYSSYGDCYTVTGISGQAANNTHATILNSGTPLQNKGEAALWNYYGISLKALQSGLISTFNGADGVTETKIAIDYNVIKTIIDVLSFIVDFFPTHTHTNGNEGNPTGGVIESIPSAITTDYDFFGSDVDTAPTYINSDGELIS